MNYESSQRAADRLGVSVRSIQKWAKEDRIPGAVRHGRSWMIPTDFVSAEQPEEQSKTAGQPEEQAKPAEQQCSSDSRAVRIAMPLLNSAYPVGKCREFIDSIRDEDDRAIAWGEYYYFSGQQKLAAKMMEPYKDSDDPVLRYSANLVEFFSGFTLGQIDQAMRAFRQLHEDMEAAFQAEPAPLLQAMGAFTFTAASVLLHLPMSYGVDLQQQISYLPEGLKLWACYLLAHKAYLEENYSGSLAIAELAMSMSRKLYPIASIYVHLVAAMDLMSLKRVEEAKQHIAQAWTLARSDGLIEPFGEHHGLLQGLIELFFQKDYPEEFEKIIAITYSFSAGWRKIHLMISDHEVADNLTTTEFTISMLYNRGWTAKEIAAYMNVAPRTITNTIQIIYQKLGISSKRELGQFMLT